MRKLTQQQRENISRAMRGKMPKFIPDNRGLVRSAVTKRKISRTLQRKGIKPPRPPIECLRRGKDHRWWKGGISPVNEKIRRSIEYKLWRKAVFKRDGYTCVWCGTKNKTIQADHIRPFAKFPELRFAVNNGRTLCARCHRTTETYGKNVWGNELQSDLTLI